MTGDSIPWQWREDANEPARDAALDTGAGARFSIDHDPDGAVAGVRRSGAAQRETWSTTVPAPLANTASFVLDGNRLFAALYSDIATGCEVVALDAGSGALLWRTRLHGLGFILHSKYRNRVQLRFVDERLVIFGDEAAGKYIEVLDPESGTVLSTRQEQS